MTVIHPVAGWPAEDRKALPRRAGGIKPLLALLCISAVLVTVMNAVAAVYLFRASGEIKAVESRLQELAAVEGRLRAKIDLMNAGLQAQFDVQNSDLRGRFGEVYGRFERIEQVLSDMRTSFSQWSPPTTGPGTIHPLQEASILPPAIEDEEGDVPAAAAKPSAKRKRAEPAPEMSTAYQRHESPDGKVYYRRMR